jgi:hypothetical protein
MQSFMTHLNNLRKSGHTIDEQSSLSADLYLGQNSDENLIPDKSNSTANITPIKPPSQQFQKPKKPLSAYIFYS